MLDYMKNDLKLAMSPSTLSTCRNYYNNTKQSDIQLSEIYLLDEIIKGASLIPNTKTVIDLLASDEEIISTYNDLISKHHYVCGELKNPMSLGAISRVSSTYMKKVGVSFEQVSDKAIPLFTLENREKLFVTRNANRLPLETAFLILTPESENTEYSSSFKAFSGTEAFSNLVLRAERIDARGIAYALSMMTEGILGDLYSIPELEYPSELSALATAHHGRVIIALHKSNIPTISAAAQAHGLNATYFAKSVRTNKLTLLNNRNISMSLDSALIRIIGNSVFGVTFNVGETVAPATYERSSVILKTSRGRQMLGYGDIVSLSGVFYSPLRAELSRDYFMSGINAVIDTLLPLIACGAKIGAISLTLKYILSSLKTQEDYGDALSAILGVYRALVELCVADSPEIEYTTDGASAINCLAKTKIPEKAAPSHFKRASDEVYLFSFNKAENGMPDFESFRGMCGLINELILSEKVSAVRAVSGKLSDTLEAMKGGFELVCNPLAANMLEESYQGFIVEANEPLFSGILLGSIKAEEIPAEAAETV